MPHLMYQIHNPNAKDTKYANQNNKYAKQNNKYFMLFLQFAKQFLSQIHALFWCTIYRPKNVVAYKK